MTTTENGQRHKLARIIVDEMHPGPQDDPMTWPAQAWRLADAVMEQITPRTITTVEELEALARGAVIIDRDGDAWQLLRGRWTCTDRGFNTTDQPSSALASELSPFTVLYGDSRGTGG